MSRQFYYGTSNIKNNYFKNSILHATTLDHVYHRKNLTIDEDDSVCGINVFEWQCMSLYKLYISIR